MVPRVGVEPTSLERAVDFESCYASGRSRVLGVTGLKVSRHPGCWSGMLLWVDLSVVVSAVPTEGGRRPTGVGTAGSSAA